MLNPCCQGVGHAFNFDQSKVKSHGRLTCVRVYGFCKLVFSTKSIEYSLVRACFRDGPLFFFCKLEYSSVRVCFRKLHCAPRIVFSQSAWYSGKFCSVTSALKAGGTTLRHSELILVLRAVGNYLVRLWKCS